MAPSAIRDYIEQLAKAHQNVKHDSDGECHFSSLSEEAQNSYARRMRYPCVVLDLGDIEFSSTGSFTTSRRAVSLFFLDHCKDTGDYQLIRNIFDRQEQTMHDFAARMMRDMRRKVKPLSRFNIDGAIASQVYLESSGLYGWVFAFVLTEPFSDLDCDHVFDDEK